jgi:hypothetical protein
MGSGRPPKFIDDCFTESDVPELKDAPLRGSRLIVLGSGHFGFSILDFGLFGGSMVVRRSTLCGPEKTDVYAQSKSKIENPKSSVRAQLDVGLPPALECGLENFAWQSLWDLGRYSGSRF